MAKFVNWVKKFVREEEGPTMVEYGLMVALVAVIALVGATALGVSVNAVFSSIAATISSTTTT